MQLLEAEIPLFEVVLLELKQQQVLLNGLEQRPVKCRQASCMNEP